jgi:hypothetical protein
MKETELYAPVKTLLTDLGFEVKAEVAHMDAVALKDDEIVVIELKTSFTLKLLLQASQRQKVAEKVYVALPAPTPRQRFSKGFREYEHLLKRLELGLILVHMKKAPPIAELIFEPNPYDRKRILSRHSKVRRAVLQEANERHADHNLGGTRGKLITVYREQVLLLAAYLLEEQPLRAAELKRRTGIEKAGILLQSNHYGWFEKVDRGTYALKQDSLPALQEYQELMQELKIEREVKLQIEETT